MKKLIALMAAIALIVAVAPLAASGQNPFYDVSLDDWFVEYVEFAVAEGLLNGVSDTDFVPNAPATRAVFVVALWRLAGSPIPETNRNLGWSDVSEEDWFFDALLWAGRNDIFRGIGSAFGGNSQITRAEMAAVVVRLANGK